MEVRKFRDAFKDSDDEESLSFDLEIDGRYFPMHFLRACSSAGGRMTILVFGEGVMKPPPPIYPIPPIEDGDIEQKD